jgi:hypothetical protein
MKIIYGCLLLSLCRVGCHSVKGFDDASRFGAPATVISSFESSVRGTIQDLPFVVLRGSDEERGRAYGALCGQDLIRVLSEGLIPVINANSPEAWDALVATSENLFVFPAEFRKQAEAFMNGLQETLSKPGQLLKSPGREIRLDDLIALHAFPDLASSGRVSLGGCSSFSAWGKLTEDGDVISGRNLDYFTFPAKLPMMIIAQEPSEPGKLRTLEVSLPGILGASTAMNEEGVFLMLHDESGLPSEQEHGWIPRVLPLRQAIERARAASAIEDIAAVLRGIPLAMGANVHVSFPVANGSSLLPVVFEWDGNPLDQGVTIRRADPDLEADALFCTNHYLSRRNTLPEGSSQDRFLALTNGARGAAPEPGGIDLEAARNIMDAAAVRGSGSTYLSVIAFPGKREMVIAVAPEPGASATDGKWIRVQWETVFGAGKN